MAFAMKSDSTLCFIILCFLAFSILSRRCYLRIPSEYLKWPSLWSPFWLVQMTNKDSFIRVLLALVFFLLFALFVYVAKEVSPNRGDAKLKELQGLSSETPAYPSFQIVTKHYSSRYLD